MENKSFKNIVRLILILVIIGGGVTFFLISRTPNYKINKTMKKMTLEQKIGQMIISYYYSSECDKFLQQSIEKYGLGGLIILPNNIVDSKQLKTFIKDVQKTAKIPMFISINQEGGNVQALQSKEDINITNIPTMEEIGQKNDEKNAYSTGKIIADDLTKFGINMNFAPVMDIKPASTRSFSEDEDIVSKMGISVAKGMKENGVIPVYKHFPGIGEAIYGGPNDMPILSKTKEELSKKELVPFKKIIKEGADIIMVGHVFVPEIDKNMPASLSKKVINNLLKKELGFDGLVITDALNSGYFKDKHSSKEILINTINAGTNMLLLPGASKLTVEEIIKAINNKKITESQIDDSVRKILELKYKYGIIK